MADTVALMEDDKLAIIPHDFFSKVEEDCLNRTHFIDQVKDIIDMLAANRKNSCYAISGTWGTGKTFVLKKIEQQLSYEQNEQPVQDKYFIFHFNCWEYDYYEEPLIAIVASMLDTVLDESENRLLDDVTRKEIKFTLKSVMKMLFEYASGALRYRTGIDLKQATEILQESHEAAKTEIANEHEYDQYYSFKKALAALRKALSQIAQNNTIIFVVDELDRCVPAYQIKVLERLHHICFGIDNVQTIFSIDKSQLELTIQKMFGDGVDSKKYLAKFIQFEICLDEGTYDHKFESIFQEYFLQFEETEHRDYVEFLKNIFLGIPMRERMQIVEKCQLLHSLIYKSDSVDDTCKAPAYLMCIELYMAVIKHANVKLPDCHDGITFHQMYTANATCGLSYFEHKMLVERTGVSEYKRYYFEYENSRLFKLFELWGILLYCYSIITNFTKNVSTDDDQKALIIKAHASKFWSFLHTIN